MSIARQTQARSLWEEGHYLDAGRILYEDMPRDRRPLWAAAILAAVCRFVPPTPAIDAVLEVARTPRRWHDGKTAFNAVREITLRVSGTDRLYEAVLLVAENTAKVSYNATRPTAPFDADTGWWLVPGLMGVCALVQDPTLSARAWTLLSGDTRP